MKKESDQMDVLIYYVKQMYGEMKSINQKLSNPSVFTSEALETRSRLGELCNGCSSLGNNIKRLQKEYSYEKIRSDSSSVEDTQEHVLTYHSTIDAKTNDLSASPLVQNESVDEESPSQVQTGNRIGDKPAVISKPEQDQEKAGRNETSSPSNEQKIINTLSSEKMVKKSISKTKQVTPVENHSFPVEVNRNNPPETSNFNRHFTENQTDEIKNRNHDQKINERSEDSSSHGHVTSSSVEQEHFPRHIIFMITLLQFTARMCGLHICVNLYMYINRVYLYINPVMVRILFIYCRYIYQDTLNQIDTHQERLRKESTISVEFHDYNNALNTIVKQLLTSQTNGYQEEKEEHILDQDLISIERIDDMKSSTENDIISSSDECTEHVDSRRIVLQNLASFVCRIICICVVALESYELFMFPCLFLASSTDILEISKQEFIYQIFTMRLNVVHFEYFESAMRESIRIQVQLTFTNIYTRDNRIPTAVPIYMHSFIYRKDQMR